MEVTPGLDREVRRDPRKLLEAEPGMAKLKKLNRSELTRPEDRRLETTLKQEVCHTVFIITLLLFSLNILIVVFLVCPVSDIFLQEQGL